jgi:exodeoxyribonuclease V alpha subunit
MIAAARPAILDAHAPDYQPPRLADPRAANGPGWPDIATVEGITDHQREQLARATAAPVGIFSGGPGTGKTHTIAALIRAIAKAHGLWQVAIAAPTGKAAVRMNEALALAGIKDIEATTAHRMLGIGRNGHDGKGWGFQHTEDNPLPYRYLFLEEWSMGDVDLTASILRACTWGTKILFIGDPYQLPPVGHGAPLRDLIAAGLPYGELTEIHRNSGDIARVCAELVAGRPYRPSPRINLSAGQNCNHIETRSAEQTIGELRRLLLTLPPGFDPVWDTHILCTVREKSALACDAVNQVCQSILNPHGKRAADKNPFRQGDKVLCTRNHWAKLIDPETNKPEREQSEFVANGEIGQVVQIEEKAMWVKFDSPARTVLAQVAGEFGFFSLGYATTVHKAQGSQWKLPILLIDDYPAAKMVASRELYVTGISRARTLATTIGKSATLNQHCRRVALQGRKTFLREEVLRQGVVKKP